MNSVEVSILSISYNHAAFIGRALDSFLQQKTDFSYEIVIADDASTDNTQEIIKEYYNKYPEIIRPVLRKTNLGANNNWLDAFKLCRGKYIAFCEGDDYWTDINKLQLQVNFLNKNSNFSLCFHNAIILDEKDPEFKKIFNDDQQKSITTITDVINGWYISSASMVFRREFLKIPSWFTNIYNGDYLLQLILADRGPIGYINKIMSVYYKTLTGFNTKPEASGISILDKQIALLKLFDSEYDYKYHGLVKKKIRKLNFSIIVTKIKTRHPFINSILRMPVYKQVRNIIKQIK